MQPCPSLGYVAVGVRQWNQVKVFHAPTTVINVIERIIQEVNIATADTDQVYSQEKNGYQKMKLDISQVFVEFAGKSGSTAGKLFMLRLLEEMYRIGYDPVVSSDLVRRHDQATIFFRKVQEERPGRRVICLAPGKSDTLVFLRADEEFIGIVRGAIQQAWLKGIQNESDVQVNSESLHEIKLRGNPWYDMEWEDSFRCRQMIVRILNNLGQYGYRLMNGVNLKGTTDTLFFFKDETYRVSDKAFCMISLNYSDRIRLIDCLEMIQPIEDTILRNGNEIQNQQHKHEGYEFKIRGYPWHCTGDEAVMSRRLINRISETFLSQGWALMCGLDLSRRDNDKSVLVFTRAVPTTARFACVALSDVDKIRLLDFPHDITEAFVSVVQSHYQPGIQDMKQRDDNCYQIKLNGSPWDWNEGYNTHARSMMCHLLKAATDRSWQLVCSADVSSKYFHQDNSKDFPLDVHSWYFVHWQAGKQQF